MKTPKPLVSAIICTHNRDRYLGFAIDSLLAQDFDNFEIIIVDNASSDRTREVVEARLKDQRLRYIYESEIGLSVARNTGARIAYGEILAYLDDDAVASSHWLKTIYAAYRQNAKLAIAGGKVTLIWTDGITPPEWLSEGLAGNLGAYDLGEAVMKIDRPGLTPRGLNYSIRKSFLDQIGGFDPNLGRVGKLTFQRRTSHHQPRFTNWMGSCVFTDGVCCTSRGPRARQTAMVSRSRLVARNQRMLPGANCWRSRTRTISPRWRTADPGTLQSAEACI